MQHEQVYGRRYANAIIGASGGPVLDKKGRVIAVISGWDYKSNKAKINVAAPIDREGNDVATFTEVFAYMAKHAGKHMDDNAYKVRDVDFISKKDGNNIKKEMIGKVNGFNIFAFT
jgi:S1-C subfamily serine protease